MKNYSFVTSNFKKYVNTCKRKGDPMTLVTSKDGENVYFVNGYTAFKCPSMYYRTDLQEIFCTDAPAPGTKKDLTDNHAGGSHPDELVENTVKESKLSITRTNIVLKNTGSQYSKKDVTLFAAEGNGIVIDNIYLDMYNLENANYYSVGKPSSIIVAKLCDGCEILLLPVRMTKEQLFINNAVKLWMEQYP